MRTVAFVIPFAFETSLRFLRSALSLSGVRVGVISADPLDRLGPEIARRVAGHWRVNDPLNAGELVQATRGLAKQMGSVERLVGVLEQLQVPLAQAREVLGLPGLSVEAALNFRDKARMKDVLRRAGVPCARHCLARSPAEAKAFLAEVGLPVVIKPQAGAGAKNTFRLDAASQVLEALAAFPPSAASPTLIEEFVTGREHSFDSVCVGGELVWASVSRYTPSPLEVLQNDWIQWTVLLPREVGGPEFEPIRRAGRQALAALGMTTGLSHMEWFQRDDGRAVVSEVAARPPGAQITTLMSYAYDADLYRAWAKLVIGDTFEAPERKYAAGAAYLRGQGQGDRITAVRGLERAQAAVGPLVVEVKLPRMGQARSSSYEGEGYVIVRHPRTEVVQEALQTIVTQVRVEAG
ncbi:MAG: ATP-grasp domain-containing protein [Planctomycetes bacterium]|nr:ATP-grasp domain-containing protein [Planctomycetota bacterium]